MSTGSSKAEGRRRLEESLQNLRIQTSQELSRAFPGLHPLPLSCEGFPRPFSAPLRPGGPGVGTGKRPYDDQYFI